jgi:FkbM family methyltransferase
MKFETWFYKKIASFLWGTKISKVPGIRRIHNYIKKRVSLQKIIINNHTLFLDKEDSLHLTLNEEFSPEIIDILKKNVKKGDTVVDIGAHIGYFTIILSDLVGNDGKVIAFEPNPTTFSILKKNIETNSLSNVILENLAISDIESEQYIKESNESASSSIDKNYTDGIKINTITLDKYFKNKEINFIKIDVQGSEFNILNGSIKTFRKKPKCIIEIHPSIFDSKGEKISSKEIIKILKNFNYNIFNVNKNMSIDTEEIIRADIFCY